MTLSPSMPRHALTQRATRHVAAASGPNSPSPDGMEHGRAATGHGRVNRPGRTAAGPRRMALGAAAIAAMGLALTSCGPDTDVGFAPSCPAMHIPAEAADFYVYSGDKGNFSHLDVHATMQGLNGNCIAGKGRDLQTRLGIHVVASRGPAATGNTLTLPWFIAVVHNDKIVGKQVFKMDVTFPPGVTNVSADSKVTTVDLPIKPTNGDNTYRFEIGFQLTQAQLDYNREHRITASFRPL